MAFEIVAFDFPDAFAAAPKVYAKKVHHCSGSTSIRVYLFLFIGSKSNLTRMHPGTGVRAYEGLAGAASLCRA